MRNSIVINSLLVLFFLISSHAFSKPALHFSATKGQPVEVAEYTYSLPASPDFAIGLSFSKGDADRLWKLMERNRGSQVALKIGDKTTMTPVVREVPTGTSLQITLEDASAFESIKEALNGSK